MTKDIAVSIVKTLFDAGYIAYFAGGWVRDYLLGHLSDEIDIATNAPPEVISQLFPKTVLVGVQFGVVVVVIKNHNFEVTTFRKDHPYLDGRHPEGVDFSSPEKDAERRDFTINGMFFDPLSHTIYDFVQGQADLHAKIIRAIGDPEKRFSEDKLRLLRAIRFAFRFGFSIEEKTKLAIKTYAHTLLPSVSMERIWQEFVKMSRYPRFGEALLAMHEFGLLQTIFPNLKNLTLSDLQHRISQFPYYPINTPTIAYLFELFPDATLEELIELCHYLKITREDVKIARFYHSAIALFSHTNPSMDRWAHFYADPHSDIFLEIFGIKAPDKIAFFHFHEELKNTLAFHIIRISKKDPVLKAHHLQEAGIMPGVKMGLLLKEGEKLSINYDLRNPEEILEHLKKTPLW